MTLRLADDDVGWSSRLVVGDTNTGIVHVRTGIISSDARQVSQRFAPADELLETRRRDGDGDTARSEGGF